MNKGDSFMKQYLLTPPNCLAAARSWDLPLAHIAFQIGPEGRLHQADLPPEVPGGGSGSGGAALPVHHPAH